ncbi:TonB-dependent receptor [Taibaiella soli]|uniref:TonB-dependent receptor n=1 Tax=Taibaiella soli TaxID=1649169 RepID=A0A2W2AWZ4_9BACT|nr:TonB-dependent receptor [Taibaiella soli]PZF72228.1 hypothetical protein DN068_14960 [Taibaiella soli]
MKTIAHLLFVYVLVLLSIDAVAQNIFVKTEDGTNNTPVALAYVNVYNGEKNVPAQTVQTDDAGNAMVSLSSFPCHITISALGYESYTQTFEAYPSNKEINIALTRKNTGLNEVVVTGLTRPTQLQNALSQYRIISSSTLQAQGSITLADALSTQLNMNVNNDAILGANITMQGVTGDKVKILIDGMPVNGRENGNVDLGQINMSNIDHIEIVQGPMSVVYGSDALGGVINLITKKNTRPFSLNAGFNYESVGKYNVDVNGSIKIKKRNQLSIGLGRNFFQGWKYNDTLVKAQGNNNMYFPYHRSLLFKPKEQYFLNLDYVYTAPSGFRLELANDFLNEKITDRSAPSSYSSFGCTALDNVYKTTRSQTRFFMDGKLGKTGHWQSQNSYSLYYRITNSYVTDLTTMNETLAQGTQGAQDTSRFDDINLRANYNNKWHKLDYTAGYDVLLEYAQSTKIQDGRNNIQDYAAYTNLSMPFANDQLVAQMGLRASYNTQYSAPVTPSFNLLYHLNDKVQLRASYARGFRAPTLKELYLEFIDVNHHIIGNPDLKAETSHNMQVSGSYQFYKKGADYAQVIVTGYYNDINNEITLVYDGPANTNTADYTYGNVNHMRNAIANVMTDGQLKDLHAQLGYAYTYTFAETGQYSAYRVSEITANIQYAWAKPRLKFSLFYKFSGSQPAMQQNGDGTVTFNGTTPSYNMMDASVERKFWNRKISIVAGVKNIFNVTQLTPQDAVAVTSANPHGGNGTLSFLPRRFFTTIRLNLY